MRIASTHASISADYCTLRGDTRKPRQCYRAALEREPSHAIAAFNLGVVLEDQGANDAAIEQYANALNLDPSLPDAHYNLARLYGWRGDRERAARHLARFRALSSDDQ